MPKPVYATVQELDSAKEELSANHATLKAEAATKAEVEECILRVNADHTALVATVNANKEEIEKEALRVETDCKAYTDKSSMKVQALLTKNLERVDDARKLDREEMEASLAAVDREIRETLKADLAALRKDLEDQLEAQRTSLTSLIEQRAREAADERARHRREIESLIEERRQELLAEDGQTRTDTAAEFHANREFQLQLDSSQDAKVKQSRAEIDARLDNMNQTADDDRTFMTDAIAFVRSEAACSLEQLRHHQDRHLAVLDKEASNLWDSYREVQELPTRRVEWIIPDATTLLLPPEDGDEGGRPYRSWFSRRFRAAGTRNLRLELRVYRPETDASASSPSSKRAGSPAGGGKADSPKSTSASPKQGAHSPSSRGASPSGKGGSPSPEAVGGVGDCALFLWCGRGMTMTFRLFIGSKNAHLEYLFADRCCHGTRKLCYLKDQISSADNTLRVGVEFLEAICEIDNQSPALRAGDSAESPAEDEVDDTVDDGDMGTLLFHRHINHRLQSQLRNEVERMHGRLVRRVEWHVEHASSLKDMFFEREAICSPVFAAAGIEGMQLILYPSGYMGATAGFCSFFLFAPAGVTIRCQLTVGNQTRDAINTFQESGAYGRTNFCMWEDCYDKTYNKVVCALEISEISQALTATITKTAEERAATESNLRMLRVPGRNSLTETKVLPGLWTSKALSDEATKAPDGYTNFNNMKAKRAAQGNNNPFRPLKSTTKQRTTAPSRNESSPAFRPTAGTERTASPDWSSSAAAADLGGVDSSRGGSAGSDIGGVGGPLPALKTVHGSGDWGLTRQRTHGSKKLRSSSSASSLAPVPPSSIPPLGTLLQVPTYVPGLT